MKYTFGQCCDWQRKWNPDLTPERALKLTKILQSMIVEGKVYDMLIGHFDNAEQLDVDLTEYMYEILKDRVYHCPSVDRDFAKHFNKGNLIVMGKTVGVN
jgi:hypothetical protein